MRDITVLDVLNLPIMANASLKAGHSGLSNIVSYVNVLDNYYDASRPETTPVNYGQNFYLTSMFHGVGNPSYIDDLMLHFADLRVSALCVIDEYLKELPKSSYDIADRFNIPVIFISSDTPYALIISSIMELKLSYQDCGLKENLLHELTGPQCQPGRKEAIIHQLNPNLLSCVMAFFCVDANLCGTDSASISKRLRILDMFRASKTAFACEYKNGIIIVRSFSSGDDLSASPVLSETVAMIRSFFPETIIGISSVLPLSQLDTAISQCQTASLAGIHDSSKIVHFKEIGISRFLLKMISHPDLEAYFSDLYEPISAYDKKYKADLLLTVKAYIEHNLDHIKTGKALHIHQNTVRYRLNKVKELIPYGKSPLDFNQSIYLLYKILKIKELL